MKKLVKVSDPSYDIIIGRGLLDEVAAGLGPETSQVLIVSPEPLTTSAEALRSNLESHGFRAIIATVPDGEESKSIAIASACWQLMGQHNFTRTDAVIGFGGGATTDLAGFVAATWLRGINLINIPTTLLGMVDASVGGKTAINTAEGKNLVGSFYAPKLVIVDLDTLETLPKNELIAGFAEVVKYGFIADESILETIEADVSTATDPKSDQFFDLVCKSISIKARVVSADFKESGEREFLNYGHTLGHAIEHAERYKWRHGAAISIGMVFAAELASLAGKLNISVVDRHRNLFKALGLPIEYKAELWPDLLLTMQRDKKARGAALRFVVLGEVGHPEILTAPQPELLFAAYQAVSH